MNLLRLYLRFGAFLFTLLALILFGIHTQPFDDHGFRALIFPANCSSACFMGIRPGITTVTEAYDQLEKSGLVSQWIEQIDQLGDHEAAGSLRWRWGSNRPALLTDIDASLTYDRKTRIVLTFGDIGTRLSFGTLLIMFGQPDMGFMTGGYNDRGGSIFTHTAGYSALKFSLVNTIQCPMTIRQFWDSPITLQIAPTTDQMSRFTRYPPRIQPFLAYASYTFCYQ